MYCGHDLRLLGGPLEPYITYYLVITMKKHFLALSEVALCID